MQHETVRLQKFLSERGIASRRGSAELIRRGKVTVNGEPVAEPGMRVDPVHDTIAFEGKPVDHKAEPRRTILLYKPRGYVCSTRGQKSPTVYSLIPDVRQRLVPVGRLDKESEGLLLMSNDGDFVNRHTHPRFQTRKIYQVTVSGAVTPAVLRRLGSRLVIDGYRIRPAKVRRIAAAPGPGQTLLEFQLREGRNRQIRKMCSMVALRVHRLVRTAICNLQAPELAPGQWRDLTPSDTAALEE